MFSVTTTASSITSPMAIAMAPSVIRLNVWPSRLITKTVMARVSGIEVALIAVMRPWRRKTSRISMASTAPISIASRTERTASRTSDRLVVDRLELHTGAAACGRNDAITRATLSAMATVFPPICRVMLISAAGRPRRPR